MKMKIILQIFINCYQMILLPVWHEMTSILINFPLCPDIVTFKVKLRLSGVNFRIRMLVLRQVLCNLMVK